LDGTIIFGIGLLAAGLLFCWLALRLWKNRHEDHINLAEAAVLWVAGEEPLPITKFDRWLLRFQIAMYALFGGVFVAVSVYGLLEEAGIL
jgi:hypothetical protein